MDPVQHFQIPIDNVERAKKFYNDVFGWEITSFPELNYHAAVTVPTDERGQPTTSGSINGGLVQRGTHGQEGISIVVTVESIDDYLKKIRSAGGKMTVPKTPVGNFGFFAQLSDTEGNILGLWQNH